MRDGVLWRNWPMVRCKSTTTPNSCEKTGHKNGIAAHVQQQVTQSDGVKQNVLTKTTTMRTEK